MKSFLLIMVMAAALPVKALANPACAGLYSCNRRFSQRCAEDGGRRFDCRFMGRRVVNFAGILVHNVF